ncbi:ABC transporter ATP-binding protein/permease [Sphingomonas sp. RB56-2]|uniref:ABC transporter ATP-binding protein/permease n=1 Tax=Sphingomonas brevis TaxID=2908206 RepID=A0ABT0S7L4_9SPHN|nr:ABC transporter ATP-binding protein [Sphingomonas brevis]MCL6740386.1 ABC transporter ATP-binding protein/permease [Sphingomonas brevis]
MPESLGEELKIIARTMSRIRRRQLALLALLMPATAIAEMLMVAAIVPFLSQLAGSGLASTKITQLTDVLDGLGGLVRADPLIVTAVAFMIAVSVTAMLRLALSWLSQRFSFGLGQDLDVEIQRRLIHQPYLFHVQRHSSEFLAALDKVDFLVFSTALQGLQSLSSALISLFVFGVLLAIDPLSATLAALLIGSFYGAAMLVARRRLTVDAAVIREAFEARLKSAQDSLGGIRDILLDRSQRARVENFRAIDARFMSARARAAFLVAAPRILVEAFGLALIAVLAVAISRQPNGLIAALPVLGALSLGAQRLLPLMSQLYSGWANLAASRPIIGEVAELINLPIADDSEDIQPIPLTTSIELDCVCFQYADRGQPAVEEISLKIPKGSRTAITGKTGSGKSTLADLLMGLIEPSKGKILIDGEELAGSRLAAWRRSVAHVPQAIFLTDDSVAANIALSVDGAEIDMDRIRRAAAIAQVTEFADALPDGFQTKIGERGARVSGGQRQRLALARAIYKNAPVLVLDEATSALDDETEAAVLKTLGTLQAQGCTIVIVAHRRSTIEGCDRIVRLAQGRLVADDG